ncbi:superoxide dismutase [Cu-Zn], chloroplastic-like isoform X2 [Orbicella faveolata]|uniref:superoxide dismutase [Cu-Zn], chloroplastic-like isoform X2 n=1 Tax=Orbicella faveolata TaxID=48498 RepID=UPI0009E608BD|nr:superoxide dismutase [Cu-Zn], chloroplastic-like isoform X2 [Orbicella faveolata]
MYNATLLLALGLVMVATASSKICDQLKDGCVVTAVSYITRNAAPPAGTDTPVVGKVKMTQSQFGGPTCMSVYISGLPPCSTHGFHIHEGNDTVTDGCQSTGGHYNPFKKTHGGPQDQIR